jgi:hypothetical protein
MTPRLASAALDLPSYSRDVFRCTPEQYRKLPVQWRGFVLHNQRFGHSTVAVLDMIERGNLSMTLDPQGVFDAYQGQAPQ